MSKIHVLESDKNVSYNIAIHFPIPAWTNVVGYSWKECGLASGIIGSTILDVGTAPSNITQEEHDAIIAGDVIEIVRIATVGISPTNDSVEKLADIFINEYKDVMKIVFKYFGYTIEAS